MAVKVEVEVNMELSRNLMKKQYEMKIIKMKNDLEEDIKSLDFYMDIKKLMEKMIIKVKILQAVQAKFMENPVADKNLIRENVEVKPDNKLTGKTEDACFESGRFSLKIPEIFDSKKFDSEAKNETATECENDSRKSDKGKLGVDIGKEKYAEDNGKEIIRKFMDIRERKLFKDDKDVKKPQENFYDFREKLNRFNPPSEATVTDFAPLKKATTASDFVDKHIVEQEDENPEPSNALEFVLQQLHTHKKEIEKYPKKKYLIAEIFTAEFALQPFTGSPFISFENWFTKFDYSLAFVQIPPSPQQKLGRLLYHLQGAAKLAYEEYDDDVRQDYDQLVAALKNSFTNASAKCTASSALSYCHQKPDESVHDFATRLTELVRTAMDGDPPAAVKAVLAFQLKEKLRNDIKRKINVHECTTYEEVLKRALDRENYADQKSKITKRPTNVEKKILECYICDKPGHYARDCYKKPNHRQIFPGERRRNTNYCNIHPNERHYREKSSSPKHPYSSSYRNEHQQHLNNYRSNSPSCRNPHERYHYTPEDNDIYRFVDSNVIENEQNFEAEFYSFEAEFTEKFRPKAVFELVDGPDYSVSRPKPTIDAPTEELNIVTFSKNFGNDDIDFEYLENTLEKTPTEEPFSEKSLDNFALTSKTPQTYFEKASTTFLHSSKTTKRHYSTPQSQIFGFEQQLPVSEYQQQLIFDKNIIESMSKVDFRREAPNFSKQICENLVIKAECHHFEPAIAQINEIFLEQISKELCQYLEHYCYSNPHFVCDYRQPQSLLTETRLKTYVLGNVNGTETLILIDKFCQKSYVTTTFLQKIDANEDFDKVMTQRIINPRILLQTVSGLNLTLNGETNEIELINIKTTNIITSFDILLGRDMIKLWTNKVKLLKIMFKLDQPLVKQDVNVALTKNFDNKFSDHTVTQTFETVNGHELTQPFSVDQYEPPSKIPEQENPLIGEP